MATYSRKKTQFRSSRARNISKIHCHVRKPARLSRPSRYSSFCSGRVIPSELSVRHTCRKRQDANMICVVRRSGPMPISRKVSGGKHILYRLLLILVWTFAVHSLLQYIWNRVFRLRTWTAQKNSAGEQERRIPLFEAPCTRFGHIILNACIPIL